MPFKVVLVVDQQALKAWRELDQVAGPKSQAEFRRRATNYRRRWITRFRVAAPRPSYGFGMFPWTTKRQQQAFHASNGFGAGIPTVRSSDGFEQHYDLHVETRGMDGFVSVENTSDHAPYLIGDQIQPFFQSTWAEQFRRTYDAAQIDAINDISQGWYVALFQHLGVGLSSLGVDSFAAG
jgi:hypothetical protein